MDWESIILYAVALLFIPLMMIYTTLLELFFAQKQEWAGYSAIIIMGILFLLVWYLYGKAVKYREGR